MTYSEALGTARKIGNQAFIWPLLLIGATLSAYAPTTVKLIQGPWQTEQEGHGPLIIAAFLFLLWQARQNLLEIEAKPAPRFGWSVLAFGLFLLFVGRTQDILHMEAFSLLPVLTGLVVIFGGWPALKILGFPISFLIFAVPVPYTIVDATTIPLKVMISDVVTNVLYAAGYPVAQNGVMIMIGSYQLLVKDACSGMNSIFALSAIGVFYVYAFRWDSKIRGVLLLAAIIPITIIANLLRVFALVLVAYHAGPDRIEGIVHDLTGIGLFILALLLLFVWDGILSTFSKLTRVRASI